MLWKNTFGVFLKKKKLFLVFLVKKFDRSPVWCNWCQSRAVQLHGVNRPFLLFFSAFPVLAVCQSKISDMALELLLDQLPSFSPIKMWPPAFVSLSSSADGICSYFFKFTLLVSFFVESKFVVDTYILVHLPVELLVISIYTVFLSNSTFVTIKERKCDLSSKINQFYMRRSCCISC